MILACAFAMVAVCITLPFVLYWVSAEVTRKYDDGYTAGWDDAVWHSRMHK